MFDKLPDLFDKKFFIGHFLPAALILGGAILTLDAFGLLLVWLQLDTTVKYQDVAVLIGCVWLCAIGLLALNYPLLRLAEGYGRLHPLAWRKQKMKERYRAITPHLFQMQQKVDDSRARGAEMPIRPDDFPDQLRKVIEAYPHNEKFVLPTGFGNRFRAIEVYSSVVYGLDAIPAWGRLQSVIPEAFGRSLDEAKAQLDFAINIMYGAATMVLLYLGLAVLSLSLPSLWLPIIASIIAVAGSLMATTALSQYGVYVKSVFDLYRGDLAKQLGLVMPGATVDERAMWADVSRVWTYRSAEAYDRLAKFRPKGGDTV